MEPGRFTLTELAQQSQVTPRTVHFYIQQGLLKPAGSPGPGAKYDDGHLARLRLIRHLQREHLPLAEIRRRLDAMDDDAVRVAVAEVTAAAAEAETTMGRSLAPESALDYVRRLLRRDQSSAWTRRENVQDAQPASMSPLTPPSAAHRISRTPNAEWPASMEGIAQPELTAAAAPAEPAESPSAPRRAAAERSQWERYSLAPDIELHVRRPLSRDQNRQVERLLALAHDIFEEELP